MRSIRAFWQGVLDASLTQGKLDMIEVEGDQVPAVEVGRYTLLGAGGQVADAGKYLVIWNTSQPVPGIPSRFMDDNT